MNRPAIRARNLVVEYGTRRVLDNVDVDITEGSLTVIIGSNACGKSTLLRALAKMLPSRSGTIELFGRPIEGESRKSIARQLSMLPQSPTAPEGIVVEDLVARGRYPHQGLLRQWSKQDEIAVAEAMAAANILELRERDVAALSGGQRQRVWIAMTLAQQTPIVLLDEPTTYLDLSHQLDVLDLARDLQAAGKTVVVVLHELNLAFRYASEVIVMREGGIVVQGRPEDVVSAALIEDVYSVSCQIVPDPESGTPLVVPKERSFAGG